MKKITLQDFITKAIEIHNGLYTYENSIYNGIDNKLLITCKKHGDFNQIASNHYHDGCGCPLCNTSVNNISEFIKKASIIHDNKYSYEFSEYITSHHKTKILCYDHGVFLQTPSNHLNGQNCPICAKEKSIGSYNENNFNKHPESKNKDAICYLLELKNENEKFLKIGITISKKNRLIQFKQNKLTVTTIFVKPTTLYKAFKLEQKILKIFKTEKFIPTADFGGKTECIKNTPENIQKILAIINEEPTYDM